MDAVNILLVDDRPENLIAFEAVLTPLGHHVVSVNSGEEALNRVRVQDFAVILLDVNMPGMDGIETAERIRSEERAKNTPIVFVTAFDSTNLQIVQAYTAGGTDYLVKPVSPDILQAKVNVFVQLYQANITLKQQLTEIQQLQRLKRDSENKFSREHSARTEAETAQRYMTFLAESSRVLTSSLDYQTTLTNLTELLVPTIADGCSIDMIDAQGNIQMLANRDVEPDKRESFATLYQHIVVNPTAVHGLRRVLQTGQSEFYPKVTDAILKEAALDDAQLQLLRSCRVCSLIIAPLKIHDRILGALTCVTVSSGREYNADDLALVEEIALRAASAIEHAELYRQAQDAIRERDEFLSVAAHELKTPITSLRGFAQRFLRQLDKKQPLNEDSISHAFRTINRQAGKIGTLIDQLLDISRIQSGRLSLNAHTVDVVELTHEVIRALQETTTKHTITLVAPHTFPVEIDPLRLEQVLTNLLSNAIKYSPDGGTVAVEITRTDDTLQMSVTDQGIGIPQERRANLFERFYQAHPEANLGGMGLGLYICREIIHLHGGSIEAQFPAESGTRFVITLPAEKLSIAK